MALPIDKYRLNLYLDEILYLMSAQDDLLIQFMLSNLVSYLYNEQELLNPHKVFLRYLGMQNFSEQELMDQLMSSVDMLVYLLKYLKLVSAEWIRFVATIVEVNGTKRRKSEDEPGPSTSAGGSAEECDPVERVMDTLIRLNLLLQRLNNSKLLPFDAAPLLKVLDAIENRYEGTTEGTCSSTASTSSAHMSKDDEMPSTSSFSFVAREQDSSSEGSSSSGSSS